MPIREPFSNAALAWYFVLIWGSGFIATKTGLQYAAPFTFLSLRFLVGLVFLLPILYVLKPRWPVSISEWFHIIVAGLLMHAIHLSGSHYAQYLGLSAGITAVILAAQPLITAMFVTMTTGEKLRNRQWFGIALGLSGVAMVVGHKIELNAVTVGSLFAVAVGLVALTVGTLYQRYFCVNADLRSSTFVQFAASLVVLLPMSVVFEKGEVQFHGALIASILFLVIFASILAVNALHTLMRRGEATRVTSMLYLPPIVAIALEWPLFGVVPTAISLIGVVVTCAGVALASMVATPKSKVE